VIACNTASSLAADFLRKRYTRIKFYNVIDPVIERLEKEMHRKDNLKIGIIGTSATIRSKSYENRIRKINPNAIVYSKACPLFAPLVEENWTDNKIAKEIVREYLKDLKKEKIDFLVLGCTHYPLLKKTISEYLGKKIEIISSPEETVRVIKKNSRIPSSETKQRESYCFSDWTEEYHQTVNNILGEEVDSKIIKIVNHF
jgi:glutamate racemase